MLRLECPSCRTVLQAPESAIGKQAKCSGCGVTFTVAPVPPAAPPPLEQFPEEPSYQSLPNRMATVVLRGERTIAALSETVEGVHNELVLTDQALYYEKERPESTTWILGVLLSFAHLFGILAMFGIVSAGHVLARVRLDQLDHTEVRKRPRAIIVILGILALVVIDLIVAYSTADRNGPNQGAVYAVSVIITFLTIACLILMPRACLVFGAHNAHARYPYNSRLSMAEMAEFLRAIAEARGQFRPD